MQGSKVEICFVEKNTCMYALPFLHLLDSTTTYRSKLLQSALLTWVSHLRRMVEAIFVFVFRRGLRSCSHIKVVISFLLLVVQSESTKSFTEINFGVNNVCRVFLFQITWVVETWTILRSLLKIRGVLFLKYTLRHIWQNVACQYSNFIHSCLGLLPVDFCSDFFSLQPELWLRQKAWSLKARV